MCMMIVKMRDLECKSVYFSPLLRTQAKSFYFLPPWPYILFTWPLLPLFIHLQNTMHSYNQLPLALRVENCTRNSMAPDQTYIKNILLQGENLPSQLSHIGPNIPPWELWNQNTECIAEQMYQQYSRHRRAMVDSESFTVLQVFIIKYIVIVILYCVCFLSNESTTVTEYYLC